MKNAGVKGAALFPDLVPPSEYERTGPAGKQRRRRSEVAPVLAAFFAGVVAGFLLAHLAYVV